jgi:hypothetical protein
VTDTTSGEGGDPSTGAAPPHLSTVVDTTPKYGRAPEAGEVGCQRCGWVHLRCTGHVDRPKGTGAYMTPCGRTASEGGTVCATHGGRAPQTIRANERRLALGRARAELEREGRLGGGQIDVDPADAMLAMVREAAFNVAVLRDLVAGLATDPIIPLGDDETTVMVSPAGSVAALMGSTSKVMEAAPHVWVNMYDAERERLVKWSKACRDAGVDEAVVRLEGRRADQLAVVLRGIEASLLALVLAAVPEALSEQVRGVWVAQAPRVIEAELRKVGEA